MHTSLPAKFTHFIIIISQFINGLYSAIYSAYCWYSSNRIAIARIVQSTIRLSSLTINQIAKLCKHTLIKKNELRYYPAKNLGELQLAIQQKNSGYLPVMLHYITHNIANAQLFILNTAINYKVFTKWLRHT